MPQNVFKIDPVAPAKTASGTITSGSPVKFHSIYDCFVELEVIARDADNPSQCCTSTVVGGGAPVSCSLVIESGITPVIGDNTNGSETIDCSDTIHFWSSDSSVNIDVSAPDAVIDVTTNETITTLTEGAPGIFTYTSENGTITVIDICAQLSNCVISDLGNVDDGGVTVGQTLVWNGINWIPSDPLQFGEYQTDFDASGPTFPGGPTINQGDWFNVTVGGTIDGQTLNPGDILVATTDNPSTTTFAGNWTIITAPGNESTTVSDTNTVDLTLTGFDITADVILDGVTGGGDNITVATVNGLYTPPETVTTLVDNNDGTFTYTNENGDMTIYGCGLPLPQVNGCVECTGGNFQFQDLSSATNDGMTFTAGAVSVNVTDGATTAPAVNANVGDLFVLNIAGLSALNVPWTINQTVTATVCGQVVQKTCSLDILPCI